ncbi:hypothetical protein AAVH_26365 [Aphelenchoides avenae]|nr:hypothetical protein AAVH_26365 [Aphelenchus avenae]
MLCFDVVESLNIHWKMVHRANVKGGLYMDGTRVHALNERLMKSVLYDHLKNILMLVPKLSGGRYLPDTICKLFGDPGGRSFKAAALANDPLNDEDKEAYAIRVSLCKEIDNWHECGFGVVWDKYRREAQGTNYLKGHQTLQPEQRQPAEAYDLNFTPLKADIEFVCRHIQRGLQGYLQLHDKLVAAARQGWQDPMSTTILVLTGFLRGGQPVQVPQNVAEKPFLKKAEAYAFGFQKTELIFLHDAPSEEDRNNFRKYALDMYANAIDAKVLNASALNHGWSLDFCLLMNVIARVNPVFLYQPLTAYSAREEAWADEVKLQQFEDDGNGECHLKTDVVNQWRDAAMPGKPVSLQNTMLGFRGQLLGVIVDGYVDVELS